MAGNSLQPIQRKNQRIRMKSLDQSGDIARRTDQTESVKKNALTSGPFLY
ncbi:hypothetical protein AOR01nite_19250 [Acetobacter orleanensis]|uniref:Uncharacterized protein n=1 Tax=Acetobacter orleanensis TaxID=104099 RepID=A0A4Y3TNQ6_9PROT|nr:hypothetical protein Abol_012_023 [Acetobacter orleanensis JCM 7639]GEB83448.1 hypothetical protein AOR01nite_19250 [Acetobacter orleanensis]